MADAKHTCPGVLDHGPNPLWREVQALTAERDELITEKQLLWMERGRLEQSLRENADLVVTLRAQLAELRAELATARALLADYRAVANRERAARQYVCPYCTHPVTDLQYHEGPEDCARERALLGDDTDPRG